MLPVLGACTEDELVLVGNPKRDFTAGGAAGIVAVAVAVPVVVKPGKTDGVAVVLLVDPPNIEDVLHEETVEVAGLVVV